jgi:hypothetical protein
MPLNAALSAARFVMSHARRVMCAIAAVMLFGAAAVAQEPPAAVLLDHLCAGTMRHNEEDRLFGMISLTVRTTLKYENAVFSPDLIDDAMQDSVVAMMQSCPKIKATEPAGRLGMVVTMIRDVTLKRLQDKDAKYSNRETAKATAADLSEELSAPEIDAWLNALAPRRRAVALFLYASHPKPEEIAGAIGESPAALSAQFREVKSDLLKFFRADWSSAPPPPIPAGPAMEYSVASPPLAALLAAPPPEPAKPAEPQAENAPVKPDEPPVGEKSEKDTKVVKAKKTKDANPPESAAKPDPKPSVPPGRPTVRITGIAPDIFAGWSLLATVTGLAPERSLDIKEPLLVLPNDPERRRMIVTAAEEISDPHDETRHFLLKAYAIDGDKDGSGLHDAFHLGAATVDNAQARETLSNRRLAAIEVARCLWHDYGTGKDPGLCR